MDDVRRKGEIPIMSREEMEQRWELVKRSGSLHSPEAESYREAIGRQSDRLYEEYGKPLEDAHWGKFVAIHPSGETIIADKSYEVLEEMRRRWGDQWCAFRRFGYEATFEWKGPRC